MPRETMRYSDMTVPLTVSASVRRPLSHPRTDPLSFSLTTRKDSDHGYWPPPTVELGGVVYATDVLNARIAGLLSQATDGHVTHCLLHASNSHSLQTFSDKSDSAGWLLPASLLKARYITINSGEQSRGDCVDEDCVFTFSHDTSDFQTSGLSCFDARCLPRYASYNTTSSASVYPVIYVIAPDECQFGATNNLFGSVLPEKAVLHGIAPTQIQGILVPVGHAPVLAEQLLNSRYHHIIVETFD